MSRVLTTIVETATRLRTGETTAIELVERCLDAIARLDTDLNAFITVTSDDARAAAERADQMRTKGRLLGPLHGVPISVKDLINLRGVPTTAASRALSRDPAAADAPVAAQLRRAGAIFIGKCNLHEFAFGTTGEDSAFGATRNPHAITHMAAGSSSGSAVSVVTGMALASIGTDTGGSIRIPSAACGVVGLKPTFGELSYAGIVPLAGTLDHVGPIGLTVDDVAIVYHAMRAGHDARQQGTDEPTASQDTVQMALPRRYFLDLLDVEVRDLFEAAVERVRSAGGSVDPVDIRHASETRIAYLHTQLWEAASVHAKTLAARADDYTPGVRQRLESARSVSRDDYLRAQETRDILRHEVDAILDTRGALILPTLPIPAPTLGTHEVAIGGESRDLRTVMLRLTQLFNLTGHPAISVPCGVTSAGLPCAIQLVGHRKKTRQLLELASRFEGPIRAATHPS